MPGLSDLLGGTLGLAGSIFGLNQARHTSDEFHSEGDPYRSQLRAMTADPSIYFKGPIAQELARQADTRYSSAFGNPAGSGTAQALSLQAMLGGYGNERDRLFKMGGGDYMNQAYPAARLGQNQAGMDIFKAGGGLLGMLGLGGGGGGGYQYTGVNPGMMNSGLDSITNAGPFGLAGF